MNRLLFLSVALASSLTVSRSGAVEDHADYPKYLINDTEVICSNKVDGKFSGVELICVSNTAFFLVVDCTSMPPPPPGVTNEDTGPRLRTIFHPGNGPVRTDELKGPHGFMYMASDLRNPGIAQRSLVDILSSVDRKRIVIMVLDNGPIYSSTNSGLTWAITSTPGTYDFALTAQLSASGTIHPSPENVQAANSVARDWYVSGSGEKGDELALTGSSSEPAPVLSIVHSAQGVVVSWSAGFPNYVLQANSDLATTNWTDVTHSAVKVGNEFQVTIPPSGGRMFYRLRTP